MLKSQSVLEMKENKLGRLGGAELKFSLVDSLLYSLHTILNTTNDLVISSKVLFDIKKWSLPIFLFFLHRIVISFSSLYKLTANYFLYYAILPQIGIKTSESCLCINNAVFIYSLQFSSSITSECHTENEIKARDPIRCRECGYRIMYKKRTKRCILLQSHTNAFGEV